MKNLLLLLTVVLLSSPLSAQDTDESLDSQLESATPSSDSTAPSTFSNQGLDSGVAPSTTLDETPEPSVDLNSSLSDEDDEE